MPFRTSVDITWSGASGSPGVNVWHARASGSPLRDALDVSGGHLEDFYTSLKDAFPSTLTFRWSGEWQGVGDDAGALETSPSWTVAGNGGTDYAPPADCILIRWRSGTGGRSGRGRSFMGPVARNQLEGNGTPVETGRAAFQDAADALIDAQDGEGDGALGIWSRTEGIFRDFVTADVPNYFAVLRSRRD